MMGTRVQASNFDCNVYHRVFTLSGGNVQSRKGKGSRCNRVVASRGSSNPSSRAASEDPEVSFSSSDPSDDESINMSKSKVKRV